MKKNGSLRRNSHSTSTEDGREYRKFTDEGEAVTKTAYEVSASSLELMEE